MKDILLKRNELKHNAVKLKEIKFDDELKEANLDKIIEDQKKVNNRYNFYNKFIKAREEVKNEIKFDNVGKAK